MKLALKAQIKEQFEGIKLEICSSVHAEVASSLARYVRNSEVSDFGKILRTFRLSSFKSRVNESIVF